MIPTLQTARLILRPFAIADAPIFHQAIYSDPLVMRYLPGGVPRSLERTLESINYFLNHWEAHGYGGWAVIERETGEFIGQCGLNCLTDNEPEIFYALAQKYWGKGIAAEASTEALRYAFTISKFKQVYGVAYPDNTASQRVMEKIGMVSQGFTDRYYNATLAYYIITAEAWKNQHQTQ